MSGHRRTLMAWLAACITWSLGAGCWVAATAGAAGTASAATPPRLELRILLIGEGSSDVMTAAWQAALTSEGVPYTLATAAGAAPNETVTLPALSSGSTGNFNGVVIADSPADYASGALTALDAYESSFGVRQVDGYMYPSPSLGITETTGGPLDGTTGTLTSAGLAAFGGLKGPIPFEEGTYGYGATVDAGAPYTPLITDSAGDTLAGVYQHPTGASQADHQAGVAELALNFDYNATQLQWLLLAPGLINWVTKDTHLGLYRNYFGQDIDDNFLSDNEWSSQFQCTPAATNPPDYTCPAAEQGVPPGSAPGVPPDAQMSAADVAYVVSWEQRTGITLSLAFNAVGACTADTAADESTANCTGSYTDGTTTYTDPGQAVNSSYPDDAGLVNALLADQADFNWINHTWSHAFLGCTAWQPQALTSATASGSGGNLAAGSYSYEITAATAYGESEPSSPQSVSVGAAGSVALTWPEATNGSGSDGTAGPSLAQEEASFSGGTGFWGYNVYREDPGSATYGLIGQVAEAKSATPSTTYSFTDTGTPGGAPPNSGPGFPTATDPGIDCSSAAGSWLPARSANPSASIGQEIGLDQAFAAANNLSGYSPAAVVTGEHSGLESPDMPGALADTGITTVAADASRQPQQYSIGPALTAPRYPSNVYYNAANWPDELNEFNTLYLARGVWMGDPAYPGQTGHCTSTSATTCLTAPATEASVLASESRIMLSHVLGNDPRVGYAHQSNLIGPATVNGQDYGYTILTLIDDMLSQYHTWHTAAAPLDQVTDVTDARVLADQRAWSAADAAGHVTASIQNGVVTVTNGGQDVKVPVTVPSGTTVTGSAFGQPYGGDQSDWLNMPSGSTTTLTENLGPSITSAASATSIVGTALSFTVTTTGAPVPSITETGALPSGITFTDNGDGTATIAGTPAAGSGGKYPITISATNPAGGITQSFALANAEAPAITSASTATFTTGVAGGYQVTTTGYPAPAITESGQLPSGLSFTDNGDGTATVSGAPASGTAGSYPVIISASNASASTATLTLTIKVTTAAAPAVTSGSVADFTLNKAGAVAVTTTGSPTPVITETGTLPAGLSFADNANGTALLSGTPTATGTTSLTIKASNGISPDATQTFTVVVGQPPAFTSVRGATATAGSPFTFTITTSGYPAPSFGWSNVPPGLAFTDNGDGTATLAGTPTAPGSYAMSLAAASAYGTAQQTLTVTVQQAPVITSAGSATFTVGAQGSFSVTTTGSPVAAVTESGSLPSGVAFADNGDGTATLAGTPAAGASGSYPITITASNGVSPDATQSFTLTVNAAAAAPVITSAGSATFATKQAGTFTVTTTGNPTARISAASSPALPSGINLTDHGDGTATLAGTPPAGSQGTYTLTVQAANSAGTASQVFVLTVNSGMAITSAASATATAGQAFSFTVTTTGSPAPALTRVGALPAGVSFTAHSNGTATLSGTVAATAHGIYPLTFTATNPAGTTSQAFTLTVNQVPAFASAASVAETAGAAFTYLVRTTSYPTAKLSSGTLPGGVSFSDNGDGTATLSGTTAVSAGIYSVTITAANAGGSTSQAFTLTARNAGTAVPLPSFTSPALATATAGTAFSFAITTAGSPTSYATYVTRTGTLPAGVSFTTTTNGTATLSGTPSATSGGTYPLMLTAKNSAGTTTQSLILAVSAAPVITTAAAATATVGSGFSVTIGAAGAPAPTLAETGALPQGLTWIDNGNGTATLAGTPGVAQGGSYKLTLTAANALGVATQAFTLTVQQAPAITSAATATATAGKVFTFTFTSVGFPLASFTGSGSVLGLVFTSNGDGTATLSGTPPAAGTHSLTIVAKNSVGSASAVFTLKVN